MPEVTADEVEKRKRMRSPAYPYINLEAAIKRAREFYDREGRNPATTRVASRHWGYEEKSSSGLQTAAALISFGLMQDEGTGEKRKVQLTPSALRILLDTEPNSKARADALKTAALAPKIHQELWSSWGNAHPSDLSIRNTLTLERDPPFNENAVDGFIREYKETIAFAGLGEADKIISKEEVKTGGAQDDGAAAEYHPKFGDYVQWEPNGILQFREPKQITRLSSDGKFAFVAGSSTGLQVDQLTEQARPEEPIRQPNRSTNNPSPRSITMREDVFSLTEGNVTFQWPTPLSADSIADLKDWLKILERKVSRSSPAPTQEESSSE